MELYKGFMPWRLRTFPRISVKKNPNWKDFETPQNGDVTKDGINLLAEMIFAPNGKGNQWSESPEAKNPTFLIWEIYPKVGKLR